MSHSHYVVPLRYYLGTGIALLILTVITVAVARVDLGALNVPVALAIAVLKASLVIAFFMGLRWDKGFNTLILVSTVVFILIFIVFTLSDTMTRGAVDKANAGNHNLKQLVAPPKSPQPLKSPPRPLTRNWHAPFLSETSMGA